MTSADIQLDIAEVVDRSGLPVSTLHVWERHGLITPLGRKGLRRQYDPSVLDRIGVVLLYQRGGFSLDEIRELLSPDAFANGKAQFENKLAELRARQSELAAAIAGLEHALSCPESSPASCPNFQSMIAKALPTTRT